MEKKSTFISPPGIYFSNVYFAFLLSQQTLVAEFVEQGTVLFWNDGMLFWEISFQRWQSGGTAGMLTAQSWVLLNKRVFS